MSKESESSGYTLVAGITWQSIHAMPDLRDGDLHVWLIKIDPAAENTLAGCLSDQEIHRAQRFRHATSRTEFIVSRAMLRSIAGNYLRTPPATLDIVYSKDGKPGLGGLACELKFNVSHSGENLLIAFSYRAEVGVDIECRDEDAMDDGTVSRSLHPEELRQFRLMTGEERREFFFDRWTQKEALLKLLGTGFAIDPTEINLLRTVGNGLLYQGDQVYFTSLPAISGYSAAVATNICPAKTRFCKPSSLFLP